MRVVFQSRGQEAVCTLIVSLIQVSAERRLLENSRGPSFVHGLAVALKLLHQRLFADVSFLSLFFLLFPVVN